MTVILQVLGWLLFAMAAFFAIRMHLLDRRMQVFRDPAASASSFALVPVRWREELYVGEGQELVRHAWRSFGLMVAFALAAMVVLLISKVVSTGT